MDQPRKVAKPARGQLNREVCLQIASVVSTYVLPFAFVYIRFLFEYMHIRAWFTAVYAY